MGREYFVNKNPSESNKQWFYGFVLMVGLALVFGLVLPDYEGKDRILGYFAVGILTMFFLGFVPYMRDLFSNKK